MAAYLLYRSRCLPARFSPKALPLELLKHCSPFLELKKGIPLSFHHCCQGSYLHTVSKKPSLEPSFPI